MSGAIKFAPGAEDNGLATMVAGLIEQNLADRPDKRADFERLAGRVAIVAEDAGVALTLEFARGTLTVHDGVAGVPDVSVRANSDDVINLSLVELLPRFGLPDPRGPGSGSRGDLRSPRRCAAKSRARIPDR